MSFGLFRLVTPRPARTSLSIFFSEFHASRFHLCALTVYHEILPFVELVFVSCIRPLYSGWILINTTLIEFQVYPLKHMGPANRNPSIPHAMSRECADCITASWNTSRLLKLIRSPSCCAA